jgi:hypothetical protein
MIWAAAAFRHLELTDKPGGEALDRGPGVEGKTDVEGEIRIADRGYSAAKALRRFIAAAGQTVDDVVRLRWSSLRLSTPLCSRLFVHASWRKIRNYPPPFLWRRF